MKSENQELYRRFLQLAAVNILSNLMVPLASLVDVAFLGHLSEIRHLAGVAIATVLFNYIYWTFGFLRMGTTGTTAQATGKSNPQAVLLVLLRNGLLALSISLIILLLQYPLRELGFFLLSATPEVKATGKAYYDTLIWGATPTLINFVLIGWFLGREQAGKVLILSLIGNGANIILDYAFVRLWGWESVGAALATALSQYLMLAVGLTLVLREGWGKQVSAVTGQIFELKAWKAALILNSDILIRTFALISTFALFTNLSSFLGTVILATNTLILQVVTFSAYFIDGLAFATESLAGNFRASGMSHRLIPLMRLSGSLSLGLGIVFALSFVAIPEFLFSLLTSHTEVLQQIDHYVLWLFPILGFGSIAYMLDGYFLGLTEGSILRNSAIAATFIGFAPPAILAWHFQSSQLLWLALTLFMVTRAVTLGLRVLNQVLSRKC
ncbi:guanitoxin biosynthesis MATE family efflux transporter GntT [Kamptonema cortianum]|nr:guanitoxin biosynthesis MATE family efflux transporter GntT [Kamptonema cortianum]